LRVSPFALDAWLHYDHDIEPSQAARIAIHTGVASSVDFDRSEKMNHTILEYQHSLKDKTEYDDENAATRKRELKFLQLSLDIANSYSNFALNMGVPGGEHEFIHELLRTRERKIVVWRHRNGSIVKLDLWGFAMMHVSKRVFVAVVFHESEKGKTELTIIILQIGVAFTGAVVSPLSCRSSLIDAEAKILAVSCVKSQDLGVMVGCVFDDQFNQSPSVQAILNATIMIPTSEYKREELSTQMPLWIVDGSETPIMPFTTDPGIDTERRAFCFVPIYRHLHVHGHNAIPIILKRAITHASFVSAPVAQRVEVKKKSKKLAKVATDVRDVLVAGFVVMLILLLFVGESPMQKHACNGFKRGHGECALSNDSVNKVEISGAVLDRISSAESNGATRTQFDKLPDLVVWRGGLTKVRLEQLGWEIPWEARESLTDKIREEAEFATHVMQRRREDMYQRRNQREERRAKREKAERRLVVYSGTVEEVDVEEVVEFDVQEALFNNDLEEVDY
jgi:hypothetical protein